MNRDYWLLWQGQLVSQLGTQAFQVLALFWLAKHTGNSSLSALFLAASLLPPVLFGPALTRWGARFSPRSVLVGCDLVAACLALPVFLAFLGQAGPNLIVLALLASNSALALTHALMMPSLHASIPLLTAPDRLSSANGWMMTTQQVASVLGQGLGGLAYAVIGPLGLCVTNMVGFAFSGLLSTQLKAAQVQQTVPRTSKPLNARAVLAQYPGLLSLIGLAAIFNVLYAPWLVLLPFHLAPAGQLDATTLGLVLSCYGIGNILGNLGLRRLSLSAPGALPLTLAAQGLALVLLGQVHSPGAVGAVLCWMGAGMGLVNVQIMTRVQTLVSDQDRTQCIAVMRSSVHLATPLGYGMVALAQGPLSLAPGQVYSLCGAGLVIIICMFGAAQRHVRDVLPKSL